MTILPFTSPEATLETTGGKGTNLARLTRAGFDVPRGFIISTDAYREFVNSNRWLATIQSVVENFSAEDVSALERASAQIRVAFSAGKMPEEIESAIRARPMPTSMTNRLLSDPPQPRKTCLISPLPGNRILI